MKFLEKLGFFNNSSASFKKQVKTVELLIKYSVQRQQRVKFRHKVYLSDQIKGKICLFFL